MLWKFLPKCSVSVTVQIFFHSNMYAKPSKIIGKHYVAEDKGMYSVE